MRGFLLIVLLFLAAGATLAQPKEELSNPDKVSIKSVSLFPNPATDYLSVKFEEPHARTIQLMVHNIVGNVLTVETELIDDHEVRLRVKDLPAGYYFLALRDDDTNAKSTFKFLKR
jgi:hypothetical protein